MNAEVIPKNVREMPRSELEDAVVRCTRERDDIIDCGQADRCAITPGCIRHLTRAADYAADYAELVASLSKLEGGHWPSPARSRDTTARRCPRQHGCSDATDPGCTCSCGRA